MTNCNVTLALAFGPSEPYVSDDMKVATAVEYTDGTYRVTTAYARIPLTNPPKVVPFPQGGVFSFVQPNGVQKFLLIPNTESVNYADLVEVVPTVENPGYLADNVMTGVLNDVDSQFREGIDEVFAESMTGEVADGAVGALINNGDATKDALADEVNDTTSPMRGALDDIFVNEADGALTFEQFGAVGDGVADDTVAIQAAINHIAITLSGFGVPAVDVLMRAGATYRITATIDIIQRAVRILGHGAWGNPSNYATRPGRGSTIRWDGAAGQSMFHLKDTFGCTFKDFYLQGNITNPPLDGIYNEGYVSQAGNHGLKVDNVRFGSWPWTNPLTTGGTVSMTNGVRYAGFDGNNDQFALRDVIFNNCGTGLNLPNAQSIWGESHNVLFENCTVGISSKAHHHGYNIHFQGCGTDVFLLGEAVLDVEGWDTENSSQIFNLTEQSGLNVRGGLWAVMAPMSAAAFFAQASTLANNLSLDGVQVTYSVTPIPLKVRGTYFPTPYTVRIHGCKGLDSLALLDIKGYGAANVTYLDIDTQGIKYKQSITDLPLTAPVLTKTANYTMKTPDRTVVGNGTSITITLPDPTNCPTDATYRVKNINSTALTVVSAGTSKTIDGAASQSLTQWSTATYICDGTQWFSVSSGASVPSQPLDSDLTTIAGLTATTDNVIQSVSGSWASRTMAQLKTALALVRGDVGLGNVDNTSDANKPVSTAQATADALALAKASNLSDLANAGTARTNLGLGSAATTAATAYDTAGAAAAAQAASQPVDSDLTTIAALTATTDNVIQSVGGSWASRTMAQLKTALALVKGDVGLGNVDNLPLSSVRGQDFLSTCGDVTTHNIAVSLISSMGTANQATFVEIVPKKDITVIKLNWYAGTTVTGNYDIGLYDASGTRLWSKGSTAYPALGVKTETVSPSVALVAGTKYYVAFVADSTSAQFRGLSPAFGGGQTLKTDGTSPAYTVTAALPLPSSVTLSANSGARWPAITLHAV